MAPAKHCLETSQVQLASQSHLDVPDVVQVPAAHCKHLQKASRFTCISGELCGVRLRGIESGFAKQVSYHVDKDLSASCALYRTSAHTRCWKVIRRRSGRLNTQKKKKKNFHFSSNQDHRHYLLISQILFTQLTIEAMLCHCGCKTSERQGL